MPSLLAVFLLLVSIATSPHERIVRTIVVRGTVTSAVSLSPIAGAAISARIGGGAPSSAVQADAAGAYVMRLSLGDSTQPVTLQARALGFAPAYRPVTPGGDTVTVNFALQPDVNRLDEVLVSSAGQLQSKSVGARVMLRGVSPTGAAPDNYNTEEYALHDDNRFLSVASAPLSTFSADVDRASYSNVRRFIAGGALPPKDAVRVEELINYFTYGYPEPSDADPVSITTDVAEAPWNPAHRIVRIGLQTRRIRTEHLPPNNLVFLLDVSGSMMPSNKLPLVKQAFSLLVNQLREQDRVAIVVYAGNAGLVLPSTSGADKATILDALDRLEAGGSTAGGAGIKLAYDIAKQNFMPRGNNRVILATDGDFNVGVSSTGELTRLVEERRAEGTYLTVLGFGMGNIKDSRLEQLADKGNGNYAYVDDLLEARKVLVTEMGATLFTVAKDVKLQVEFNPAAVQAYRLIGYENRLLRNEDFVDDKKDAGDMGAGHSVTALYEIIPVGAKLDVAVGTTAPLRYQRTGTRKATGGTEAMFVNVRYKLPQDSTSRLLQHAVSASRISDSADLRFAMAVAGYGLLLRDSEFKGTIKYDDVIALAKGSSGDDRERAAFVSLVESTRRIASGIAKAGQ